MTDIKLDELFVTNFKGIKSFNLSAGGKDITVSGDNATGKTTLFDAFTWLLFGKDSTGAAKFNAKPLDSQMQEILGLEPDVTASLLIDGKAHTLHRHLKEVWVKPAGKAEKVRKPDRTELYIDDVPQKVKEYDAYISGLMNSDLFTIITNPAAFAAMKWDTQREILMQLIPNLTDTEVAASSDDLKGLLNKLAGKSIADQQKVIVSKRRTLKQDIDALPARIDEANRAMPDVGTDSEEDLKKAKAIYEEAIETSKSRVADLKTTDQTKLARQKLLDVKNQYMEAMAKYQEEQTRGSRTIAKQYDAAAADLRNAKNHVAQLEADIPRSEKSVEILQKANDSLKAEWVTVKAQSFDGDTTCPTCGQPLPADQVEQVKKKWNLQQSIKLTQIKDNGVAKKKQIEEAQKLLSFETEELAQAKPQLNKLQRQVDELEQQLTTIQSGAQDFDNTKDGQAFTERISALSSAIEAGDTSADAQKEIDEETAKIEDSQNELQKVVDQLAQYQAARAQRARIAELTEEDTRLKATYAALEKQAYLIDQFTRRKVDMLQERINKKFKLVSFKLFENQKNGELKETCEAAVNGVPYSDLNNAARINAGLDIINTLSDFYHAHAPIFVDNAESVNDLLTTDAQQIRLVVTHDKELKVEG